MQEHIKKMAVDAGFNLDPETGLILDTAGVYSVDDAVRLLAQAVARDCVEVVTEHVDGNTLIQKISARYGVEG